MMHTPIAPTINSVAATGRQPTVIVIGACCLDRILTVETYPTPDSKVRTTRYNEIGGGNAANTATAMALLANAQAFQSARVIDNDPLYYAMKIKLVSKVGDDTIADTLLENLQKAGVDTTYVIRAANTTTSVTTVIVDSSANTRTCLHTLGTCGELTADETRVVMDKLLTDGSVIHVHSDGRHAEAALLLAREARLRNIPLSVDIEKDRHSIEVDWLLKNSTLLFTNSNQMGDYLARLERQYMESSPQKSPWKDSPAIGKAVHISQAGLNVYLKALKPSAFLTRWSPMPGKEVVITQGSRGALCIRCHSITKEDDHHHENLVPTNDVTIAYYADDDFIDILQNTSESKSQI